MNNLEVKDMQINIELDKKIILIGDSSSGKTFLLRKLINKVPNDDVYIDGKCIKEYDFDFLRKSVMAVFNDNNFECDLVIDEIGAYAQKLGIEINISEILKYFKITKLKNKSILTLSTKERAYIKIISYLVLNPLLIGIDGLYEYLDSNMQKLVDKYINEHNIHLINVLYNLDYVDFTENVILLNNKKAVFCGMITSLIKGNSILPYLGFKLPFITDLSQNLILYGLIDSVLTDNKKVVDSLWN